MDNTHRQPDPNRTVTGLQDFNEEMQQVPNIPQIQMDELLQQLYALTGGILGQINDMTGQMTSMASLLNSIDNRLQNVENSITALTTRIDASFHNHAAVAKNMIKVRDLDDEITPLKCVLTGHNITYWPKTPRLLNNLSGTRVVSILIALGAPPPVVGSLEQCKLDLKQRIGVPTT